MMMPDTEERIQAVADELLRHDIRDREAHTCLCGAALWQGGGPSMARHRAEQVVLVDQQIIAKQESERLRQIAVMRLAQ